ncbi:MAG: hypothetical protein HZA51_01150 [Planctomycetes bacterium]|nr:hypothetical protein [Planctomycetota bacterium]
MGLHPQFPDSPYEPLIPDQRWFPADETLRTTAYEKLLPPLVAHVRQGVFDWRASGYEGANRPFVTPKRSIFNRIVGEARSGGLELKFAKFLDDAPDVAAHSKNYLAVVFRECKE